ncbi:hypothetical protein F3Y22_tig00117034pilonHSYRG00176 [Hibiscus syriacus]|uniref:Uncharacterized protein n=1 Tax=Hibiscus syriacus TaxID=106335 RepID=A0A6A2XE97_HIBSY|nr:hypothetical protein F3Y22_tig00117034pilonHSYRG00176 [Hibiscus syriacus]
MCTRPPNTSTHAPNLRVSMGHVCFAGGGGYNTGDGGGGGHGVLRRWLHYGRTRYMGGFGGRVGGDGGFTIGGLGYTGAFGAGGFTNGGLGCFGGRFGGQFGGGVGRGHSGHARQVSKAPKFRSRTIRVSDRLHIGNDMSSILIRNNFLWFSPFDSDQALSNLDHSVRVQEKESEHGDGDDRSDDELVDEAHSDHEDEDPSYPRASQLM